VVIKCRFKLQSMVIMLSFKRTNNAQKLLCQVGFLRVYRAVGF